MRIEPVIAISGSDTIGPTRIRLHTASSGKLPVVITTRVEDAAAYYVYDDIAALQSALANQSSTATIEDALPPDAPRRRWASVASTDITGAEPGTLVNEGGRLIGITAAEIQKTDKPTEPDEPNSTGPSPHPRFRHVLRKRHSSRPENQHE